MPYCSCHPISAHKKLRLPDWFVSNLMLDRALDAILKRINLDRTHDIPGGGGVGERRIPFQNSDLRAAGVQFEGQGEAHNARSGDQNVGF